MTESEVATVDFSSFLNNFKFIKLKYNFRENRDLTFFDPSESQKKREQPKLNCETAHEKKSCFVTA